MGRRFTDADIAAIIRDLHPPDPLSIYCPYTPFPKQKSLLDCNKSEVLYGGSAAGGKTFSSLMKALQHVHVSTYNCLIIRNTYADLQQPGCQIPISKDWWGKTGAKWNGTTHQWLFPSGAIIAFGYLEHKDDKYNYRSSQYQKIIIDEASLIDPESITYMFSRLRSTDSRIKTQMILMSNPGGPSHDFLKDRFITNPKEDTAYIPSTYLDNKAINQEEYEKNLRKLTAIEYRQLALGEWIVDASKNVYHFSDSNVLDSPEPIPHYDYYVMAIDLGYIDDSAITVIGWNKHDKNLYVVFSQKYQKCIVSDLAEHAGKIYNIYKPDSIVVDSAGAGKMITQELSRRYDLPAKAANKQDKEQYIKLVNADLENHVLHIYSECTDLISEMKYLRRNKHNKEEASQANHACDSCLYAFKEARAYAEQPWPKKKTKDEIWEDDLMDYNHKSKEQQEKEWFFG